MRLIDADKLKESIVVEYKSEYNYKLVNLLIEWIDNQPTVESAPTTSDWINVNDRLPRPNHVVLIYVHNRKLGFSYRVMSWLSNDRKWVGNSDDFKGDEVTHWTELPEPPKEEGAT